MLVVSFFSKKQAFSKLFALSYSAVKARLSDRHQIRVRVRVSNRFRVEVRFGSLSAVNEDSSANGTVFTA